MPPRLRMIAGPNGSGKTTLLNELVLNGGFNLGHILNPDRLEAELIREGYFDFSLWGLECDDFLLNEFFLQHPLVDKVGDVSVQVKNNTLVLRQSIRSGYFIAVLSDFIRREWVKTNQSFTFETVMSSSDKITFLSHAKEHGFRTYLYFVCTENAYINEGRVRSRVGLGGHDVPQDKIHQRYTRTLGLLRSAVERTDRAYLFDNSQVSHQLVAEYAAGQLSAIVDQPPNWLQDAMF